MSDNDKEVAASGHGLIGSFAVTGAVITIAVWGIEELLEKAIPAEVAAAATTLVYAVVVKLGGFVA